MPNGCVPGKEKKKREKSLLTTKLKRNESGAAEEAWKEEEVSPEELLAPLAEAKREEGQERDKMATYEHLQPRAFPSSA